MTEARDLRVSDAEREHVVQLLQRATGTGLLDLDEFTDRVDAALAARTRGELNAVLLDLPGITHPDRPAGVPARHRSPHRPARQVGPTGGGVEISSLLSSVTRRGEWDVPAHLVVRSKLGSTELDFSEARIPHDVVQVELDVVAGSVELRMPAGATVDHQGVRVTLGSIEDKRRGRAGEPTGLVFVLTGAVRAGSVEIKAPKRSRRWRRSG